MKFFKSLLPSSLPDTVDPADDLKIWQERLLQYFAVGGCFIGLILSVTSYFSAIANSAWALFIGSVILFTGSLFLALRRKISYWVRSIAYLVIVYVFANMVYSINGWSGVALLVLLGFSFLATILLYRTPTRVGLGISLVTVLFWSVLYQSGFVLSRSNLLSFSGLLVDILLVITVGTVGNFALLSLKSNYLRKQNELKQSSLDQINLTQQLNEQSKSLEKRLFQLKTASEISQKVSTILDPDILIQQVADLVKVRFELYYVGVFLIDSAREYAVLKYGTGEAGKRMLASKHRLAVGGYSMIGWATQTKKPRVALDVGDEAVHFDNPFLPNTRSELALPIVSSLNVLGAISIQSEKENAFDENDILILQSVADSIGIALENANSFKKTQEALAEIQTLNRDYVQQSWWNTLNRTGDIKFEYENERAPEVSGKRTAIHVPIKIREEIIGHFNIEADQNAVSEDQIEFIESISTQTSIALENARLLAETQRAALQEQKINEITANFSKALTIEEIIKTAVMEYGKLPAVSEASIALLPPEEANTKLLPDREDK
jgi:GAF domain-containing protein